jgi:peptide chain release factor 1
MLEEPKQAELDISREIEWTACRGSGAGGQHRNKTSSAVQIKHIPTGIMVRCESERSQHHNRETAMALLRARVFQLKQEGLDKQRVDTRRQQVGLGMRGDKRRTIRQQDGTVKDHLTNRTWRYEDYVRGKW